MSIVASVGPFDVGDTVTLKAEFFSDAAMTIPADPTAVTLQIKKPDGTLTTPTPAHTTTGVYLYDLDLTAPGRWRWRYVGTGAVKQAETGHIDVRRMAF